MSSPHKQEVCRVILSRVCKNCSPVARRKQKQREDVKEEAAGPLINKAGGGREVGEGEGGRCLVVQLVESLLLSGCTFVCTRKIHREHESEIIMMMIKESTLRLQRQRCRVILSSCQKGAPSRGPPGCCGPGGPRC